MITVLSRGLLSQAATPRCSEFEACKKLCQNTESVLKQWTRYGNLLYKSETRKEVVGEKDTVYK